MTGRVFRSAGDDLLYPTTNAGHPDLRREPGRRLADTRGNQCAASQIIVTNGAQAALDLVMRILLQAGSRCLVEDPAWPGFSRVAAYHRADTLPVPLDHAGIDLDRATARRHDLRHAVLPVSPGYHHDAADGR